MINRIIIADDSKLARTIIKRCLEIGGCSDATFFEAENGKIAFKFVENNNIDMLVTDLNMPEMSGIELLKKIKTESSYKDIPVILITSASNPALNSELKNAGAFEVLKKPVSPSTIANVISKINNQ